MEVVEEVMEKMMGKMEVMEMQSDAKFIFIFEELQAYSAKDYKP